MTFPIFYDGRDSSDFDQLDGPTFDEIPADEARELIKEFLDAELLRRTTEVDQ